MLVIGSTFVAAVTAAAIGLVAPPAPPDAIWEEQSGSGSPIPRASHRMAYDAGRDEMIVFGGYKRRDERFIEPARGTWAWDGSSWEKLATDSPPTRQDHVMEYDPVRDEIVLFGGARKGRFVKATWVFADGHWTRRSPQTSPGGRTDAVMAFDPHLQQLVMFGGSRPQAGGDRVSGSTWTWDGETWHKLDPATSPAGRIEAGMAYDPASDRIVLFGGRRYGASDRNDTWSWDGHTWAEMSVGDAPLKRSQFSMATFDGHVVVSGGRSTWEYVETTSVLGDDGWQDIATLQFPSGRISSQLEWDPVRREAVLFGGTVPKSYESGSFPRATWTLTSAD